MCHVSNTTRSISTSQASGEIGNIGEAFTGKSFNLELENKAKSVPVTSVFRYYNINLDTFNCKTTCPFPSHKGGRERTPSFNYYAHTNTFYCFGCGKGGGAAHFIMYMEGLPKLKAIIKVIEIFGEKIGEIDTSNLQDFSETLSLMLEFSTAVREFRQEFSDKNSFEFIENVCFTFDEAYRKYNLDNKALSRMIRGRLLEEIELYKCKQ